MLSRATGCRVNPGQSSCSCSMLRFSGWPSSILLCRCCITFYAWYMALRLLTEPQIPKRPGGVSGDSLAGIPSQLCTPKGALKPPPRPLASGIALFCTPVCDPIPGDRIWFPGLGIGSGLLAIGFGSLAIQMWVAGNRP